MENTKWRVENCITEENRHSVVNPWVVRHPSGVDISYHETWVEAWRWLKLYLSPEVTVNASQSWAGLYCVVEIKGDPALWEDLSKEE